MQKPEEKQKAAAGCHNLSTSNLATEADSNDSICVHTEAQAGGDETRTEVLKRFPNPRDLSPSNLEPL